jgi:curved DNA-binding protein CbpA
MTGHNYRHSHSFALVRYHSTNVSTSDRQTEGQLSERPLAELIRELVDARLSGAIRLSNDPAKVVVYFEKGELLFATSNLRAHRLREVFKRNATAEAQIDEFASLTSDEELAAALVQKGTTTNAVLQEMRSAQATDVLRLALLWTAGHWSFDRRVRVAGDLRVAIDVSRLLLESARHLPLVFLKSRVGADAASYSIVKRHDIPISPTEALTLSRVSEANGEVTFAHLARKGLREEDALRGIYALRVAGVLSPGDYQTALGDGPTISVATKEVKTAKPVAPKTAEVEVNGLFARLNSAKTHYEVLEVGRAAELSEIKNAYHDLARRFHPDRFHQSDLRARIESAFARIGRAYETLSDEKRRKDYDKTVASKHEAKAPVPAKAQPAEAPNNPQQPTASRAETSFKLGTEAFQRKQHEEAIRYLAEAATLEPRVARYRAYYGAALTRKPNLRRTAETELQAALKLEPNNAEFRVMLAELYQQIGLRKRAEHEAARALNADPTNKSARDLLANLTRK